VQADARLEATKIEAERDRTLMEIRARGKQEVEQLRSETDKLTRQVKAEAKVTVAKNDAKAVEALGAVEQKAGAQLKVKRQYDLEMENVQTWGQMAKNSNILIATEVNSFAAQLFSVEQLASIAKKEVKSE